jgi:hypothetical protein
MKEVEKKDLPDIPGAARPLYPTDTDVKPSGPLFPGYEDFPRCPATPVDPTLS